ncbi:hypothetical protein ABDK56_04960 [Sphingomonas sp. ASV193]|uniref:hypothetical protein n=1 Tax=Sphingomonas sp. ASV193 TaxID=3144405 RepID=UPI0032E8F737
MGKLHFWLIGAGAAWLGYLYYNGFPYGGFGIGTAFGAIGLGIRQWSMASAHKERQEAAISGNYRPQKDKWHYHGPPF